MTRRLSRFDRFVRSFLKRFMYSQMAIRSGFLIAIGKEQPLIRFNIEKDPPSIYLAFRIKTSLINDLVEHLRIPSEYSLSPIRCLSKDKLEYLMVLNVYRVSGVTNGIRAEWSVFIRDTNNTPRYMIIETRSSRFSMDPIKIITKASKVIHERIGNIIQTQIGEGVNAFNSKIILPDSPKYVSLSPEWIAANDEIYWGNGINDRTYYDGEMANPKIIRVADDSFNITDGSVWSQFLESVPSHVLVLNNALELVVSPWYNVDKIKIQKINM